VVSNKSERTTTASSVALDCENELAQQRTASEFEQASPPEIEGAFDGIKEELAQLDGAEETVED
jgi:hypothetical protein